MSFLKSRREFISNVGATAGVFAAAPAIVRAQQPLSLYFRTIPDPDGWHPSLRLKGDWLVFEVTDGRVSGFGEASHSRDDAACRAAALNAFATHYTDIVMPARVLTTQWLARKERELAALNPDFVTATALSGINQALHDYLAKKEQVPVWQLFQASVPVESIALYTTINRTLTTRTESDYRDIVATLERDGFDTFKCAPFEAVTTPDEGVTKSSAGLATLAMLRNEFPDISIRVDFHERFKVEDFFALLPQLEALDLDWIEEPFAMGAEYAELNDRTAIPIAAGELFWGLSRFAEIAANRWADVIMPDVKHIGGFGPLLDVIRESAGKIGVSPHNPSGPISTAASLHAAALNADVVRSIEYAFDRQRTRAATGEIIENGRIFLTDQPGWGVTPPN